MARKLKKFSAGGAQGRYDSRMKDIDKDFAKDSKGKSGKALEVLEAKRAQRTADAKDDLAKRTGADRTATRAAEAAAESNLTKTRKYGAPQSVTKDTAGPTGKVTDTLGALTAPKSGIDSKPQSFGAAFKEARARLGAGKTFTYNGKSFTTNIAGEGKGSDTSKSVQKPTQQASASASGSSTRAQMEAGRAEMRRQTASKEAELRREANRAAMRRKAAGVGQLVGPASAQEGRIRAAQKTAAAVTPVDDKAAKLSRLKVAAEAPGATQFAKDRYKSAVSSGMYAKGGTVKKKETTMKYAKGGSTPNMNNKPKTPKTPKEPITGGADTVPLTPERKEFLKELAKRNAKPGMAKGGKATKFGAAMVKKSADTKGRAMVKKCSGGSMKKYASGGSVSSASKRADGCATKGKTKGTMLARGGSALMRSRDSYGGANFKKGGSC
jgi:hypothetical protein